MTTNKKAKGPYTVTSTVPEGESYTLFKDAKTYVEKTPHCSSGFWDDNGKGDDNSATACTEKPEKIKGGFKKMSKIIIDNDLLRNEIKALYDYVDRDEYNLNVVEFMVNEIQDIIKGLKPCEQEEEK